MANFQYPKTKDIEIPQEIVGKWQKIADLIAQIINVPTGLIMKVEPPYIEVFRSSRTKGNPYKVGDREHLAGLYCEEVITTQKELLVPDARESQRWKDNPDIELGMVSYLGFPLEWPDGEVFGTICVLDSQKNEYSGLYRELMEQFKENVEAHLKLVYQKKEVERERDRTKKYLEAAGHIVLVLDERGNVIQMNRRGSQLLGYEREEILGKNWIENFVPELWKQKIRDAFEKMMFGEREKEERYEAPVITRDGNEKTISWHHTAIKNGEDKIIGVLSSGNDITERKKAEEKLKQSLQENKILLREVQHRVKNSLSMVLSLMRLQSGRTRDTKTKEFIETLQKRVKSISDLYAQLYQSGTSPEKVKLDRYLQKVVDNLKAYSPKVEVTSEIVSLTVAFETALSLGLIVNELVTNAYKYGFPGKKEGHISVKLEKRGKKIQLVVEDNGAGLSSDFDLESSSGMGLHLVKMQVEQHEGSFDIRSDGKTRCVVSIRMK
ncbi:PAS domain S-box protein [bacterium]|nr:PAS domain S-box protein [bacterium]